ncbi:contact-dependent growth inhibition system immunity protein [Pseudomonas sp. Eth.TT006]
MTNEEFPQLFQFLGAYFHEDWMSEFDFADDVVRSFIADSEVSAILDVIKEIEAVLALDLTEQEIRDFVLAEMGCSYCYWHDWQDGNHWLQHVLVTLQRTSKSSI